MELIGGLEIKPLSANWDVVEGWSLPDTFWMRRTLVQISSKIVAVVWSSFIINPVTETGLQARGQQFRHFLTTPSTF